MGYDHDTVMAGTSKSQLIANIVAFYPEPERAEWTRWYRDWTRSALEHQATVVAAAHARKLNLANDPPTA